MSTAILVVILVFGLIMPLFWIIGAMTSVGFFCVFKSRDMMVRYRAGRAFAEQARDGRPVIPNPQLGLTMADGGDSIQTEGEKRDR